MSEAERIAELELELERTYAALGKLVDILLKKKVIDTDDEVRIQEAQEEV